MNDYNVAFSRASSHHILPCPSHVHCTKKSNEEIKKSSFAPALAPAHPPHRCRPSSSASQRLPRKALLKRILRMLTIAMILQFDRRQRAHERLSTHLTNHIHRRRIRLRLRPRGGFLRLFHRLLTRVRRLVRVTPTHDDSLSLALTHARVTNSRSAPPTARRRAESCATSVDLACTPYISPIATNQPHPCDPSTNHDPRDS